MLLKPLGIVKQHLLKLFSWWLCQINLFPILFNFCAGVSDCVHKLPLPVFIRTIFCKSSLDAFAWYTHATVSSFLQVPGSLRLAQTPRSAFPRSSSCRSISFPSFQLGKNTFAKPAEVEGPSGRSFQFCGFRLCDPTR